MQDNALSAISKDCFIEQYQIGINIKWNLIRLSDTLLNFKDDPEERSLKPKT